MKGVPASTYFSPHLRQLRMSGYVRLSDDLARFRPIHDILHNIIIIIIPVYVVQIFFYSYSVKEEPDKAIQAMILFFGILPAYGKITVVRFKEKTILRIINEFNDPLFNQDFEIHREILCESASSAAKFLYVFFSGAIFTSVIWTIYPLIEFTLTGKGSLDCSFGFDYNNKPYFYFALFYVRALLFIMATGNSATDCLISAIMGQCKTQLTLLRLNFENLYENSQKHSKGKEETFETGLHNELVKCVKHYEKIYNIIKEHQAIFGPVILLQLNISAWIICVIAYRLVIIDTINLEFICMCMFMLLMITEFFVYCFYGNEVKYESEQLIQSIYQMEWQDTPLGFQKDLLIPMEKFQEPIAPTAMKLIPLSLDTFVKILQSSYTFYAVLNKTQH